MRQELRDSVLHYLLAVVAVAAATCVAQYAQRLYPQFLDHGLFAAYIIAVALVAWRGGLGPALLCIALSVAVTSWWFLPPKRSFHVASVDQVIRIMIFTVIGLVISSMHAARARAVRALRDSDMRLGFALESSGVGCWDADIEHGVFWRSVNLPGIFGLSESEFATTAEGFFAYVHPDDRDFFRLASVTPGPRQRDYEINHRIVRGDGSVRQVNTRGRMYLDERGRMLRMVGAVTVESPARVLKAAANANETVAATPA